MAKQHIILQDTQKTAIEKLLQGGTLPVKTYQRCQCLLLLDKGKSLRSVSSDLSVSYTTVCKWRKLYQKEGLDFLYDRPRSGRPVVLSGEQRAKITALACSESPSGRSRWTLRLLADKAVDLDFCEQISHSHVRTILKKTN
jgi:transposase